MTTPLPARDERQPLRARAAARADAALAALREVMLASARRAQARADGVDGVGVTVAVGGGLVFSSGDAFTRAVDEVQESLVEGPCVTATTTGELVRLRAAAPEEPRWTRFVSRATPLGLVGVVSVPLFDGDRPIGSLNLYGRTTGSLDGLDDLACDRLAQEVGSAVASARLVAVAALNTARLVGASQQGAEVA